MSEWYECEECVFATNSPRQATRHEVATGHTVTGDAE
jgi:hypothetical protein